MKELQITDDLPDLGDYVSREEILILLPLAPRLLPMLFETDDEGVPIPDPPCPDQA